MIMAEESISDAVHIRRARPEETPAIVDLIRASMPDDTVDWTPELWRWKHEANPFGVSPVLVAEADGQLVGLRAFMRWTWQCGAQTADAVRAVDTATHPDFRGRGIFKRLTLQLRDEMEAEGVDFVFNTPNAQSRPGYLKMGWQYTGRPTIWLRLVRPSVLMRALREGQPIGGVEGPPPPIEAEPAADVLRRPAVEELVEIAGQAAQDGGSNRYRTACTLDYLRWRYADIPALDYRAVAAGRGANGAVLLVRTRQRGLLRELRICDAVVGPGPHAGRHARDLLREVSQRASVDVVVAMSEGMAFKRWLLLRARFIPVPYSGPILTTYPLALSPGLPSPTSLRAWGGAIGAFEFF